MTRTLQVVPISRLRLAAWETPLERCVFPIVFAANLARAISGFVYTLLVKKALLDGWPGWYYALQRTVAESILSLKLAERRLLAKRNEK